MNPVHLLGGPTALAAALSASGAPVKRDAVLQWVRRGVPWRYRNVVAAIAAARDVDLPDDFLRPSQTTYRPEIGNHPKIPDSSRGEQ